MHLWEVIVVSIGLSLEAFNLAIIKGANQKLLPKSMFFFMSLLFGAIETIMLSMGVFIVLFPMNYIHNQAILIFNKWFSAIILLFLGLKMFKKIKSQMNVEEHLEADLSYKEVTGLAIRTGFDALLLGIVFALLSLEPFTGIYVMFIISSILVGLGLWLGGRLGSRYKFVVDGLSGGILLVMGIKVITGFFEMI